MRSGTTVGAVKGQRAVIPFRPGSATPSCLGSRRIPMLKPTEGLARPAARPLEEQNCDLGVQQDQLDLVEIRRVGTLSVVAVEERFR